MASQSIDRRGFFISLDGPDGAGKTTQVARVAAWLRTTGRPVVMCRDPGGTALGDRLRSILLDRHETPIGMRAEMLLYMASRAQLVEEVIGPALERGEVVVSDRFLLANVVYQGLAGGLPETDIWEVGRAATRGLLPDLTLLLDVPPDVALGRCGGPRDRIEDRSATYRRAVRDGFLTAARSYPAPLVVLDATAEPEAVFQHVQSEVARALGGSPRT
jgi:dTMP kinase